MTTNDLDLFNQAVGQAQSGQKTTAYTTLKSLSREYPNEANLLLWLAFTAPDLGEAERSIDRIALLEPTNANLPQARSWLAGQQQARPAFNTTAVLNRPEPTQQSRPAAVHYQEPALTDSRLIVERSEAKSRLNLKSWQLGVIASGVVIVIAVTLLLTVFAPKSGNQAKQEEEYASYLMPVSIKTSTGSGNHTLILTEAERAAKPDGNGYQVQVLAVITSESETGAEVDLDHFQLRDENGVTYPAFKPRRDSLEYIKYDLLKSNSALAKGEKAMGNVFFILPQLPKTLTLEYRYGGKVQARYKVS